MRHPESLVDVIDLAYQAALEPQLWPGVLAATAATFEASRALILRRQPGGNTAMFASQADEPLADSYFSGFEAINPIQQALNVRRSATAPTVYADQDLLDKSSLVRTEFYDGFMRPADMHDVLMLRLGDYTGTVNIFRGRRAENFDRRELELAERMQRSLDHAWVMGERLGARRAIDEALADFLDRLPGAVLLVSASGRIAHANAAAETLIGARDGLSASGGLLEATALPARGQLRSLLAKAAAADVDVRSGSAMAVPRPSGRRPLAVLVAPARGEAALLASSGPLALVCITDPEAETKLATERLRGVFGFTPAEARVAAEFAAGHDPATIAERLSLSRNTVREQIMRVRAKTDTHRQGELIALVLRILGVDWIDTI